MKTQEYLEQQRKENVHIPKDWAVLQSASGKFLGFLPSGPTRADVEANCKAFRDAITERMKIEKDAVRESKLSQL